MKRILMAMVLCLVCTLGFAQAIDMENVQEMRAERYAFAISNYENIPSWDYIGCLIADVRWDIAYDKYQGKYVGKTDLTTVMDFPQHTLQEHYSSIQGMSMKIYQPNHCVLKNWQIGYNCTKSGKVIVGIGIPLTVIGGIIYSVGLRDVRVNAKYDPWHHTPGQRSGRYYQEEITAGGILMGIGGTCISVSVPLFIFGDHIRRECNMIISK